MAFASKCGAAAICAFVCARVPTQRDGTLHSSLLPTPPPPTDDLGFEFEQALKPMRTLNITTASFGTFFGRVEVGSGFFVAGFYSNKIAHTQGEIQWRKSLTFGVLQQFSRRVHTHTY